MTASRFLQHPPSGCTKLSEDAEHSSFGVETCYPPGTPGVILAGGWGRRMLPATTVVPKGLLPVGGIPLVEHVTHELADAGIREIHVLIRDVHRSLAEHLRSRSGATSPGASATSVVIRGTGEPRLHFHTTTENSPAASLRLLSPVLAHRGFVLTVVDELIEGAHALHRELGAAARASGCTVVSIHDPTGAVPDRLAIRQVEEPTHLTPSAGSRSHGSAPRMIGRYFCTTEVFEDLNDPTGIRGGDSLFDAFDRLARKGRLAGVSHRGHWWDCGQLAGYTAANIEFAFDRDELREAVLAALSHSVRAGLVPP